MWLRRRPKVSRARGLRCEAALAVALRQQVMLRPLQHGRVDVVDAGHVAELQQAVGGQRLVGGRGAAEPLVALLRRSCRRVRGTRTRSACRSRGQQVAGPRLDLRLRLVALLEVVEDQQVG